MQMMPNSWAGMIQAQQPQPVRPIGPIAAPAGPMPVQGGQPPMAQQPNYLASLLQAHQAGYPGGVPAPWGAAPPQAGPMPVQGTAMQAPPQVAPQPVQWQPPMPIANSFARRPMMAAM